MQAVYDAQSSTDLKGDFVDYFRIALAESTGSITNFLETNRNIALGGTVGNNANDLAAYALLTLNSDNINTLGTTNFAADILSAVTGPVVGTAIGVAQLGDLELDRQVLKNVVNLGILPASTLDSISARFPTEAGLTATGILLGYGNKVSKAADLFLNLFAGDIQQAEAAKGKGLLGLFKGASKFSLGDIFKRSGARSVGSTDKLLENIGPLRTSARKLLKNEDVLIDAKHSLQSRTHSKFDDVIEGSHGNLETKYLWTIDKRGVNVALESTPFPTPRGNIVHTNVSEKAAIGGEAWFGSNNTVTINAGSGRFGDGAGITESQWNAAIKYWENLGYTVNPIPFGQR